MNIEHIEKLELGESCEYCLEDSEDKEFYIMEDGSTICCDSSDCRNTHFENMNFISEVHSEGRKPIQL